MPFPDLPTADVVLLGVAVPMVLATLAGYLWPIRMGIALGLGSLPASGTIGYALFYDPPDVA